MLIKGVPAVIQDLKELYLDAAKVKTIEDLLLGYLSEMDKSNKLDPSDTQEQDPTVYLWLMYYISYHFYFVRNVERAF